VKQDAKPIHLNHAALAEFLAAEIAKGDYLVGDRFPTEIELQERFKVGRHTIREALKVLTENGMLGRRRKTGSVVLAAKPVSEHIHSLRDIRGLLDFAANTVLDIKFEGFISRISPNVIGFTENDDSRWYRIAGLRYWRDQDEPLCWSVVIVPEEFAPQRPEVRAKDKAIYELVMEANGLKFGHVEQDISAIALPGRLATMLKAAPDSPALLVKRRYVASSGATFEISHNYYPSGRYAVRSVIRQRE
jgi:GntR family transcriptional regulator